MPSFWTSGLGGRSPVLGGGGIGSPGAPQGSLQTGGVMGPSENPTGASALRPANHITEYGRNNGPCPMFRRPPMQATWKIIGVTRDSSGNPLGNCIVDLFIHGTNSYVGSTISDAGGNYLFVVPMNSPYWVRVTDQSSSPTIVGSSLVIQPV